MEIFEMIELAIAVLGLDQGFTRDGESWVFKKEVEVKP